MVKRVRRYDIEAIRSEIGYDPTAGRFWWECEPGTVAANGYRYIKVNQELILAHRLAWMMHYGREAPGLIDHINGDRLDNRIGNLRLATFSQNGANARRHSRNTSGLKGASWERRKGRWQATITVRNKQMFLGYFDTKEQAHEAYLDAAKEHHGEFANGGLAGYVPEKEIERDWLFVASPRYGGFARAA